MKKSCICVFIFAFIILAGSLLAQNHLTVTTWNIETLGGEGRGFAGGYGKANLAERTPEQLKDIAALIKNVLTSDIVAMQEISITHIEDDESRSEQLDTITQELGASWEYYLPDVDDIPDGHDNMFCALMWNEDRVKKLKIFPMDIPNHTLGGAYLYARQPIVGYFEALKQGQGTNDFVVINTHLKSGQGNEENHIIAIVELEHRIYKTLKFHQIKESDRIIVGDFNDNPYAKKDNGEQKYSDALYDHMTFKGYLDLVTSDFHSTRMDSNLKSVIDHILVNKSAKNHISMNKASIYLPGDASTFGVWRKTYSDHFPISFEIKIESQDDDVDYQ